MLGRFCGNVAFSKRAGCLDVDLAAAPGLHVNPRGPEGRLSYGVAPRWSQYCHQVAALKAAGDSAQVWALR
jgi:hypothetical protein